MFVGVYILRNIYSIFLEYFVRKNFLMSRLSVVTHSELAHSAQSQGGWRKGMAGDNHNARGWMGAHLKGGQEQRTTCLWCVE